MNEPRGLAVVPVGDLWVVDHNNNRILKIAGKAIAATIGGDVGFQDGPVADARFSAPHSVALHHGVLYVTDKDNCSVRAITAGMVRTIIGSGDCTSAVLSYPTGIAVASADRIYVADESHKIWLISPVP